MSLDHEHPKDLPLHEAGGDEHDKLKPQEWDAAPMHILCSI